jgi:hypothetical protein
MRGTAINSLSLFAGLLSAGGMGLWHGVEYYEKEKVVGEEFYQQWNNVSQNQTCPWKQISQKVVQLT